MNELPIWFVQVTGTERITPHMARITFGGDDLAGFNYSDPDQQVKLYFPRSGQAAPRLPEAGANGDFTRWYQAFTEIPEAERPWMRSYTIRHHHPQSNTIDIDFVLHPDAGPATRWAQSAQPGDTIALFGPSSTFARPLPLLNSISDRDWLLLAGDETALPAISSLIESLPEGARALAYIEVRERGEEQQISTRGESDVRWLHRGTTPAGHSGLLVEAVRGAEFPPGTPFAWLAGESGAVRALRRHLVNERGLDKGSIEFTGHWRLELSQDDAPTEEDLAEAAERTADSQAKEEPTPAPSFFDDVYVSGTAPWVIGEPQPAVIALERDGWIRGAVLDAGCGTGEHTIHLAQLGYDVYGIDSAPNAVEQARTNAAEHGITVSVGVADALHLGGEPTYDTVVDSALFHIFDAADRAQYVRSLHRVCRPGALVHILALSDAGPGFGPQISDTVIREAFGEGWVLEDLRTSRYRGVTGGEGELGDLPAWLARARRI